MADHLARIFGTEEDKVNCPFYYKIGACRHGDRCSRNHMRPHFSQTVLIPHMYTGLPPLPDGQPADDTEHFEDFFEEISEELMKFGEVEQLQVVENLGEHMLGNVYIKYRKEEEAEACMKALMGRFYGGRMLTTEYSPVTDFNEARCRQFDEGTCNRGGYCNFMHLRRIPQHLRRELRRKARKARERSGSRDRKKSSRKDSRERDRRSRSRSAGRSKKGEKSDSRDRETRREKGDKDKEKVKEESKDKDVEKKESSSSSSSSSRPERRRSRSRERHSSSSSASASSSSGGGAARSGSEERRAKVAAWNAEKKKD